MVKTCKGCLKTKPFSEFYSKLKANFNRDPNRLGTYSSRCKPCHVSYSSIRARELHPKGRKTTYSYAHRLQREYGISPQQYEGMLQIQGNVCAGCKKLKGGEERGMVLDHDHTTSEPRGILCTACNLILGYAKDSPEILKNLIDYLTVSTFKQLNKNPNKIEVLSG